MSLMDRLNEYERVTPGTLTTETQRRNLRAWMLRYRVGISPWVRRALEAKLPPSCVGAVAR